MKYLFQKLEEAKLLFYIQNIILVATYRSQEVNIYE